MQSKTGVLNNTGKMGSGRNPRHLFLFLFFIGVLCSQSLVYADWDVNLSDPATNINMTVTTGRLVLGNVPATNQTNITESIALLNCDEGAGGWCYDQTPFNNSAQLTNGSWSTDTPGGTGASLEFTGTEHATILNDASNDLIINGSYGAFYNYSNTDGLNHSIMMNGIENSGSFFLYIDNAQNKTWCKYYDTLAVGYSVPVTSQTGIGGVWHQTICVINTTHLSIYHDGVFNNSVIHAGNPTTPQGSDWAIGIDLTSAVYEDFYGLIDEAGIWNRTLIGDEINLLWVEKSLFFLNETVNISVPAGNGVVIYQFNPTNRVTIQGATAVKDNNANLTISYSVLTNVWSAYSLTIADFSNDAYTGIRVKVNFTEGNTTNPWVSSITVATKNGMALIAIIFLQFGTVLDALISITPSVITIMAYFAAGGFIVALLALILGKAQFTGGG